MIPAVIERCAGIDVGRKFIDVCVMVGDAHAVPTEEIRRFSTLNEDLERLKQWLQEQKITHVVMESTGSYWRPIHNVLDDGEMEILLANPQHVKNLRGHKTDRNDARWLAHLLRHGMIRPSFVPGRDVRELRDLTRRRKQMVGCAAEERNRVQRTLQEANVQLGIVLSDLFGESGLSMLDALMNPDATPEQIAELALKQARKKIPVLRKALEGHRMTDHHRRLIRHSMEHLAFLEEEIAELDQEIAAHVQGHEELRVASELAQSVPGIRQTAAASIVAETGGDMSQFPDSGKLASWIGTCPGNNITGGKRKSSQTRKGNPWARQTLVECAWSATRKKNSEAQKYYGRMRTRLKHKPALMATAHLLTVKLYEALATGKPYQEDPNPERTAAQCQRLLRHHSRRLKNLRHWLEGHRQRSASNEQVT
jgi:transposase